MFWFGVLCLLNVQQRCFKENRKGSRTKRIGVVLTGLVWHGCPVLKFQIVFRPICHAPGRLGMMQAASGQAVITPGYRCAYIPGFPL